MASTWSTGAYAPRTSPSLVDLLPEVSGEEKARFPPQGCIPERQEVTTDSFPTPIAPAAGGSIPSEASPMDTVCDALRHYNAEHPGAEFDAVKAMMQDSVHFRGKVWYHINFLARSRSSKNIKLFFAEVHYELQPDGEFPLIPVVEACAILDESFSQNKISCAFCRSHLDRQMTMTSFVGLERGRGLDDKRVVWVATH